VITIDVSDVVTGSIDESDEIYAKRMKIISEFLRIASKYVLVNVHRKSSKSDKCPVCDVDFTETEDFYLCPECGIQITKVKEVVIEHDQKIYESKVNLLKAFNKLQGKDSLIPNDMYKTLDEYCLENNIPISSEVRSMELNPDGTRGNVNIDLLQLILRKTGYKNQYENIPLIAHEYWGWTLYDDLDEYKEEIFNEYDKLEGVLESLKDKDESSSPNVQYKLYRLVSRCYPKCSKSHFRLPKDIGKLESKTYRAYKILGWKFDALAI
jgi:hypothetical protein